jgi:hypothetical protein
MHLYLTSHFQRNTKFITESGQILYRTQTPLKGAGRTTTISKVVPSLDVSWSASRGTQNSRHDKLLIEDPVILNESASQDSTEPDGIDMQDKYAHLATIHWNLLKSSTLTFGDKTDVPTAEYFKKASFSPHGRYVPRPIQPVFSTRLEGRTSTLMYY